MDLSGLERTFFGKKVLDRFSHFGCKLQWLGLWLLVLQFEGRPLRVRPA
jgi:hypothetical protein